MAPLDWQQPYRANRSPVCADNVVATSQPLATEAGLDALARGGNAVDAALAAAITLTVVEPVNTGVGSDAFCILWDGARLTGLNASGRSPAAWRPERFAGRDVMPRLGWDSVTVPGAVSAWMALSECYGVLDFAALFDRAIHYAEAGFPVGPKTAYYWRHTAARYDGFAEFERHFLPAPAPGTRFRRPELAATLRLLARTRGEAFYRGELAQRMAAAAAQEGGALSADDLAAHTADWVAPVAQRYRDVVLHEIPPNGQGLAAQIALGILRHLDAPPLDSAEGVHLQIEAMKLGIRAAFDHISDAAALRTPPQALLDPTMLARLAGRIGHRAAPVPPAPLPAGADTVYLAAADADGMMVSFIQSNFEAFGSGVVVPGTGIALQNRGAGFSLDPEHPNCVAPRKRPFHTIIPGFVSDADDHGGAPRMAFGVMGGHMQHQGHVQMVTRVFDHGQNPQAASDAPRWHVYPDYSVGLERDFTDEVATALAARGHRVRREPFEHVFGGAQLVLRTADGYVAGSDHRKEGHAGGF
ncbi:MAG: gamma-glutamyltransferase family protein [Pseudomonadota bacterium]